MPRGSRASTTRLAGAGQAQPQNRYGLPAFYERHLWLWKPNPAGTFEDWNPESPAPSRHR